MSVMLKAPLSLLLRAKLQESASELIPTSKLIQCLLWETSGVYLSLVMCGLGDSGVLDQHPRPFKSTDSSHRDWVRYSRVLK